MSDIGEAFAEMRLYHKRLVNKFAVECPRCKDVRPKAHPTKLLPGQFCKVDGFQDLRPLLTKRQKRECR